jgi:hypothetical protein
MTNESFTEWQERTLILRTKSINIFLSITLATIGFIISKILDKEFEFRNCCAAVFLGLGASVLLINTIALLILMLNRLKGFRITTQIAKKRSDPQCTEQIDELRKQSLAIDNKTHCIFQTSVFLFLIGEVFTVIGFGIQIWPKLVH